MFRFPDPPELLTSHQIQCISCKHTLRVSEDTPQRKGVRSKRWHVHQAQEEAQRLANSGGTNATHANSHPYHHIICPRCGAENDNWLYVSQNRPSFFSSKFLRASWPFAALLGLAMFVAMAAGVWVYDQRASSYGIAFFLIILLAAFLPFLLIPGQWQKVREYNYFQEIFAKPEDGRQWSPVEKTAVSLWLFCSLALPTFLVLLKIIPLLGAEPPPPDRVTQLTQQLPALIAATSEEKQGAIRHPLEDILEREYQQKNQCQGNSFHVVEQNINALLMTEFSEEARKFLTQAQTDVTTMKMDTAACQKAAVIGLTDTLNEARMIQQDLGTTQASPEDCAQKIQDYYKLVLKDLNGCQVAMLEQIISELRAMETSFTFSAPGTIDDLSSQAMKVAYDLSDQKDRFPDELEKNITTLENLVRPPQLKATLVLYAKWILLTGVVSFLACVFALWTVNYIVQMVDPHLPRPVFHRVSRMVQAVSWDIKHALTLNGHALHVEVRSVSRLEQGGISLNGLLTVEGDGSPEATSRGRGVGRPFTVKTDRWARFVEGSLTNILSSTASAPHGTSSFSQPGTPEIRVRSN
jgi:hypothetical protein